VRPRVVDKTGLSGSFDFNLEFAGGFSFQIRDLPLFAWRGNETASEPAGSSGISLFAALEQQLGLKLIKNNAITLDVLSIDSVDKVPTEN
jgi:uncharacterized protein (TIGR03435 family)